MSIYPGASVRLIDTQFLSGKPLTVVNRSNLHTQAGLGSLFGFFNRTGRASSHFWVSKTGLVEQYVDTALRAEADLEGNDATISTETEGSLEPWTPEQLEAIIALQDWILNTHGLPRKLCTNSFVGNESSRGLGWHRLGIDGNFPAAPSRYAGRTQLGGGMHYSLARGKLCPGDARIDQIFDVIAPRLFGGVTPPPVVPPVTPPVEPPPSKPAGRIDEDGIFGADTIGLIQTRAGLVVDREFWYQYSKNKEPAFTSGWVYNWTKGKGSPAVAWVQRKLGVPDDGVWGDDTTNALIRRAGGTPDNTLDYPSNSVRWLQHALNTNTF